MDRIYIENLPAHEGETVTINGWLYNKRSSGKIRFPVLRDGTGYLQGVMVKGNVPEDVFARFDQLTQETSLSDRTDPEGAARPRGL